MVAYYGVYFSLVVLYPLILDLFEDDCSTAQVICLRALE
jgi:hypothetical protein